MQKQERILPAFLRTKTDLLIPSLNLRVRSLHGGVRVFKIFYCPPKKKKKRKKKAAKQLIF